MTSRLLVVEDDSGLRDVVARGLRQEGYEVLTAVDGAMTVKAVETESIEAIVLDVGLPDCDGHDLCIALRSRGVAVPVVFLTARASVADRVSGFAAGGDDYVCKPFAFPELLARLRAVLRRSADEASTFDDLRLDPVTHSVSSGRHSAPLSPIEFRLLAKLLATPGAVVRRQELVAVGWPVGAIVSENTLDQFVSKLRRKLSGIGTSARIQAARGIGYRVARAAG